MFLGLLKCAIAVMIYFTMYSTMHMCYAVAGQNVLGGGGGQFGQGKPRGSGGKVRKVFEILLQMHQIIKTSSYTCIWGTHLLIAFLP